MLNAFFAVLAITMLSTQLPASTGYSIGVKSGDWIKYDETFYQKRIYHGDYGENSTVLARFDSLIQILQTEGTMITFNLTQTNRDGSTRWKTTYVVDPTQPYNSHPEIAVHHYLIPSNLSAGSPLPEPILFSSGRVGSVTRPAWSQVINETRVTNVLGMDRETNYVHWIVGLETGVGSMHMERECTFDKGTGIALAFANNSTVTSLDDLGFVDTYVEFHHYRVKDTNMWAGPQAGGWGTAVVIVLVLLPISFILFVWLKSRRRILLRSVYKY